MPSAFVGIDVSKASLDVHWLPSGGSSRAPNTPAGHAQLVAALLPLASRPADLRVVLESTGGLELAAAIALGEAGVEVAIIQPERARAFATARGQLAKTDAIDAAVLACFARDIPLAIVPLPSQELRQFRELLDRRHQLVEVRTMESNRLGSTTQKKARTSPERHVAWIDKELEAAEREPDRLAAGHARWAETDRIRRTTPGIGSQVARTLIGHLPELGQGNRKVIGQLVGVAPVNRDSGRTEAARHIVGGRWQVRNALDMAAVVGLRHNPVGRAFDQRLKSRGKSGKAAVIACAHELLTIANAMIANKTVWRHSDVAVEG